MSKIDDILIDFENENAYNDAGYKQQKVIIKIYLLKHKLFNQIIRVFQQNPLFELVNSNNNNNVKFDDIFENCFNNEDIENNSSSNNDIWNSFGNTTDTDIDLIFGRNITQVSPIQ